MLKAKQEAIAKVIIKIKVSKKLENALLAILLAKSEEEIPDIDTIPEG